MKCLVKIKGEMILNPCSGLCSSFLKPVFCWVFSNSPSHGGTMLAAES